MILKFQQGGASLAPLVSYTPVVYGGTQGSTGAQTTSTTSSKRGSDLTDKDLLEMLKGLDGLPSDMTVLTQALQNFYIDQQYGAINTSNIASKYISVLNQMKVANFNKKEYDEAFNIVKSNGGINEYAISERGDLICINKEGNFKQLSVEELKSNKEYTPLTNSELLYYRAQDPTLAGKNNLLKVVKNGIGIQTVTKLIKDGITGLGHTQNSTESYAKVKATQMLKGIEDFIKASKESSNTYDETLESLYKSKKLTKNQTEQAAIAIEYLWNTLPENAKTLLKLKSETGDVKGAYQLMQKLITSSLDTTLDYTLDLDETPSTSKSKDGSTSKSKDGFKMDPVSMLQAGYGQKQSIVIQNGSGYNNGIQVNTVRMPIVSKEGKSIGTSATLDDVSTSGFSGYLDLENASMGGVMIPTVGFNNIAINGTALYTAYLPVDVQEYSRTGNIKPDIDLLGRYKQAQDKIAQENITDPQQINAVYQEFKLPIMFGENGDVLTNYMKFGIVNAVALEDAFNEDVSLSDYITEVSDENVINNTLTILNKGRAQGDKIDFDAKSWIDSVIGTDYDHVFKGTVFIPVNEDYFTGSAGFGNYPSPTEAKLIEAKQQAKERENAVNKSYVNPGRL